MAVQIGSLYFTVSANTSAAQQALNQLGRSGSDSAAIIDTAMKYAFTAVTIAAASAAAAAVASLAVIGAKFNAAGQQAVGLFTALTGSLDQATDMLAEFSQLSLDNPIFDAATLQKTTSMLLTFGIANEDAIELAKNINLTAIGLGRGVLGATQLARAIGQIESRGWLEGDEARQLSEVGVNAYQVIADAIGKTTGEVIELGRQNKLLAEDVIPILSDHLEKTFGPVAQNLLNTYGVQAQGVKNILTGIGSALVEPFIGRTGGGVIVDFLKEIRAELEGVIEVTEDGSFRFIGALEPINDLTQAIADGFAEISSSAIEALGDAMGSIDIAGFAAGAAEIIPKLVSGLQEFASGTADFLRDLFDAIQPVFPAIGRLAFVVFDLAREALPILLDIFADVVRISAPIVAGLLDVSTVLLALASPAIIAVLEALAAVLGVVADVIDTLGPALEIAIAAWVLFGIWVDVAAASFIALGFAATTTLGVLGPMAVLTAAAAASFIMLASAMSAIKGLVTGDSGWLTDDVPWFMKPGQAVGQAGFEFFGGDLDVLKKLNAQLEALFGGREVGLAFADSFKESGLTMSEFGDEVVKAGLSAEAASFATLHYAGSLKALQAAHVAAAHEISANEAFEMWENRLNNVMGSAAWTTTAEDGIDIMKELEEASKDAWEEVDRLMSADQGATIDDFLRSLPDLAEQLTDALAMDGGILRDLEVGGTLQEVRQEALAVIRSLAEDFGMSMEEIEAMFDERGLAGVIEALGMVTEETTETVDPLIAKYGQLGATVDQIRDAIASLNEQRQNAIQAQIDAVEIALEGARDAAIEARQAIRDFLSDNYLDSPQELVDQLILDIGNVGSTIEDAIRTGGVRGEAAIRQALSGVQSQIAGIVSAGLEAGLSGQEIVDLLGPVLAAINEEMGEGGNRIVTLDFDDGFLPAAAAAITDMLSGILDPAQIQQLINNVLGADATVSGLEDQLDSLRDEMGMDVVFSPEQVQAAIDALPAPIVTTTPTVTPEAAQAVWDEIQVIFDDPGNLLDTAINKALITDQILAAAKEAEDSITLDFDAGISFDEAVIAAAGLEVGDAFAVAFSARLAEIQEEQLRAANEGFLSPVDAERALGLAVAGALFGSPTDQPDINVEVTTSVTVPVDGSGAPPTTATDRVSANSTAAGTGGRVTSVLNRYGYS